MQSDNQLDCILSKIEDYSDDLVRRARPYIPVVGRFLLVSTFFEDFFRMVSNPEDHLNHFEETWRVPNFIAIFLYLYCIFALLVSPTLILLRKKVPHALLVLAPVLVFQGLTFKIYSSFVLSLRFFAVAGGVFLIGAELMEENKVKYGASLPGLHEEIQAKSIVILAGRCYLVAMMITLVGSYNSSILTFLQMAISFSLCFAVAVGYRTKLSALALSVWLMIFNIIRNNWWNVEGYSRDYRKFDFFQTLSVIGGLLLLIHMGGGKLGFDSLKKQW